MPLPLCKRIDIDADPEPWLRHGWREIEQLVTYERFPVETAIIPGVHLADERDYPAIRAIAAVGFTDDRLHRDPEVDDEKADCFKMECVDKAIRNTQRILVWGYPQPAGFLIMRREKKVSCIDLMAVYPDVRRQGIGKLLVIKFLSDSRRAFDATVCRAGTQAHNTAAMKMYLSLGFREVKRERTFHK